MESDYFKYGIVLSIISFTGIIMLYKFIAEDKKNRQEDGKDLGGLYGSITRKYKRLMFLFLFFIGLCLLYNAIDIRLPIILEDLFGESH